MLSNKKATKLYGASGYVPTCEKDGHVWAAGKCCMCKISQSKSDSVEDRERQMVHIECDREISKLRAEIVVLCDALNLATSMPETYAGESWRAIDDARKRRENHRVANG